jgi:hypothetical protein
MVDGKSGEEAYENGLSGQAFQLPEEAFALPDSRLLVFPVNSMYRHIASLICS